jgi:Fe-S-cluster containining protein
LWEGNFGGDERLRDIATLIPHSLKHRHCMAFSLRSFRQKAKTQKTTLRRFLGRLEKNPPRGLDTLAAKADAEVWQEVDCLSCGNCCKQMTPTFKKADVLRISEHLGMTPDAFRTKWLTLDDEGKDWINKKQPCQFLDMKTNMCSIYAVRPADCAGFPYLKKKKMIDYIHIHQQNVEYCPATVRLVEKMKELVTRNS